MTLFDAINKLDTLDEGHTIYCKQPWSRNAAALVAAEPEVGGLPDEAICLGLSYFLEVRIAKEVLSGWIENRTVSPSQEEKCDRVMQYAINDA